MSKPVGLLTLQGDYDKHRQAFHALGRETFDVRRPAELAEVSCLVIPGGESTTLTRLVDRAGLREPLGAFAAEKPVMGTCAGLIMLAAELTGEERPDYGVKPLGLLDCTVMRNGYGRQIDSFTAPLSLDRLNGIQEPFPAVFIRAPRITSVGPEVEVLASYRDEPVIIRQGHLLAMAFHPELTADQRIHRFFLELIPG
ncbi:MAG: pyridoxal 5'-phosphate synthase glutaminase subunit PdxT [Candidatus Krumholzibacteriota bacterium]